MIETIGWLGSILFALCGLPQAIHSFKNKSSDGLTWSFLLMWGFGEVFTLIYISQKENVAPLLLNYLCNFLFLSIIIWFKIFPKEKTININTSVINT